MLKVSSSLKSGVKSGTLPASPSAPAMNSSVITNALRVTAQRVPGARWAYRRSLRLARRIRRLPRRIRRAVPGPNRAELYDIQTLEVMRRILTQGSECLDVGAHNGSILRNIVALAPGAHHHAVEALPHLAARLAREFPSVSVHGCAVSDEGGERMFTFVEDRPAYSGLRPRAYDWNNPITSQISVTVRTIDDLVPAEANIRLIKLDIEGGEYHALLGAKRTLRRCQPVVIFEFELGAADYYEVKPAMLYSLLCDEIGLRLSTMQRWLLGHPHYDLTTFSASFENHSDYYYMAYPPDLAAGQATSPNQRASWRSVRPQASLH